MQKLIKNFNYFIGKIKNNDRDVWDELEEQLVLSDVNAACAQRLIGEIKSEIYSSKLSGGDAVKGLLKQKIAEMLSSNNEGMLKVSGQKPTVYLIVGVNGVGKTSTLAKIANMLQCQGKKVLIAAADTYRAAAAEQVQSYAERMGVEVVRHQRNSDPGAVVYDSIEKAAARDIDFVLVDTAGRMQTSYNLMEELKKIKRVVNKKIGREPDEILMVIDSTTGQNAIMQANTFNKALGLSGIVLTKTDGTSKGGIILSLKEQLGLPIKLVTFGEKLEDISLFDPKNYTDMLIN
ncbi:MAG: signal recognition particle-docking protein FtsY [Actinomycetota bacterium]